MYCRLPLRFSTLHSHTVSSHARPCRARSGHHLLRPSTSYSECESDIHKNLPSSHIQPTLPLRHCMYVVFRTSCTVVRAHACWRIHEKKLETLRNCCRYIGISHRQGPLCVVSLARWCRDTRESLHGKMQLKAVRPRARTNEVRAARPNTLKISFTPSKKKRGKSPPTRGIIMQSEGHLPLPASRSSPSCPRFGAPGQATGWGLVGWSRSEAICSFRPNT